MVSAAGLSPLMVEGPGTQYLVWTTRKAPPEAEGLRPYILPGEPWAEAQLGRGWHPPVDRSWRPVEPESEIVLAVSAARPEGPGDRFIEIPDEPVSRLTIRIDPPCARPPPVHAMGMVGPPLCERLQKPRAEARDTAFS